MYHSRWKGTHYNAGFHYGNLIYKNGINLLKNIHMNNERKLFSKKCIPLYKEFYPEIIEEIKGIADGQKLKFENIAEFLFSMYCFTFDNKCSCFAISKDNKTIFGRNSDFLIDIKKFCDSAYYNLDNSISFIGNTTAYTQIEDGVNEYGLAAGLTFIFPTKFDIGFNAGMLIRYILEKCKTTQEAITKLKKLPIASPQTITLADKTGDIAVVECNCDKISLRNNKFSVFTTNHFNNSDMLKYQYNGEDDVYSHKRYETLKNALINCNCCVEFSEKLLSGKKGFLCQYDKKLGIDTIWSSIFDLTREYTFTIM